MRGREEREGDSAHVALRLLSRAIGAGAMGSGRNVCDELTSGGARWAGRKRGERNVLRRNEEPRGGALAAVAARSGRRD